MAKTPHEFQAQKRGSLISKMAGGVRRLLDNRTGKPVADIFYTGYEPRVQYPRLAMPYWAMYETVYMCSPARIVVNHLVEESFRNRGKWKESFAVRCGVCRLRMKHYPKDGRCERISCKSQVMMDKDTPGIFGIAPDDDELTFFNTGKSQHGYASAWRGVRHVNNAGESLWQVLRQIAFDLCVTDDAYLIAVKQYEKHADGKVYGKVQEIVRGHPNVVRIVSDDYGNRGGLYYQCPLHRTKVYARPGQGVPGIANTQQTGNITSAHDGYDGWWRPEKSATHCDERDERGKECGVPLKNVWYVATDSGGAAPKQYYFQDECLHLSYFTPSVLYGVAPTITLYREMRSLIKIYEYVQTYFEKRRIPRGIVAVNTAKKESVNALKAEFNKQADDNQQDIPFVGVEGANARGWIEFIPFADKLNEMDLDNLKADLKHNIGAFFGVSPIFQGDMSQGGGINNEGLQITVTNRSVEAFQTLFNEKLFPWISEQFGIVDHEFVLNPSEEKDFAHVHQLELLKLQVSQMKAQNGLQFRMVDENGDYVHDDKPNPNHPSQQLFQQQQPMGQGGGVPPEAQAGAYPGGTQPGAQQQSPVDSDQRSMLNDEAGTRFSGEPSDRSARGDLEDLF